MSDSRVITEDFDYFVAKSIDEVVSLLSEYKGRAKVIAGGTDFVVGIKMNKVQLDCVINIMTIGGIDRIQSSENGLTIGAGCIFYQLEAEPTLKKHYMALFEAIQSVSSVQIKNMGTLGGNVCNGSPAADSAPALLVFGAQASARKREGQRVVSFDDFFIEPGRTTLSHEEMLTEIRLPSIFRETGSAFLKVGRVSADLAKVSAAAFVKRNGKICEECRIALGAVAKTPMRVHEAEKLAKGEPFNNELAVTVAKKASEEILPIDDVRSTREYRKEVARVIVTEALEKAWKRAGERPRHDHAEN